MAKPKFFVYFNQYLHCASVLFIILYFYITLWYFLLFLYLLAILFLFSYYILKFYQFLFMLHKNT